MAEDNVRSPVDEGMGKRDMFGWRRASPVSSPMSRDNQEVDDSFGHLNNLEQLLRPFVVLVDGCVKNSGTMRRGLPAGFIISEGNQANFERSTFIHGRLGGLCEIRSGPGVGDFFAPQVF